VRRRWWAAAPSGLAAKLFVLVLCIDLPYRAQMFDPFPEPVPDAELEAVLFAALRSSGAQITRPTECFMATAVARHLVDRIALAGLHVVRFPDRRLT
jgi:hypothetical protein